MRIALDIRTLFRDVIDKMDDLLNDYSLLDDEMLLKLLVNEACKVSGRWQLGYERNPGFAYEMAEYLFNRLTNPGKTRAEDYDPDVWIDVVELIYGYAIPTLANNIHTVTDGKGVSDVDIWYRMRNHILTKCVLLAEMNP